MKINYILVERGTRTELFSIDKNEQNASAWVPTPTPYQCDQSRVVIDGKVYDVVGVERVIIPKTRNTNWITHIEINVELEVS